MEDFNDFLEQWIQRRMANPLRLQVDIWYPKDVKDPVILEVIAYPYPELTSPKYFSVEKFLEAESTHYMPPSESLFSDSANMSNQNPPKTNSLLLVSGELQNGNYEKLESVATVLKDFQGIGLEDAVAFMVQVEFLCIDFALDGYPSLWDKINARIDNGSDS